MVGEAVPISQDENEEGSMQGLAVRLKGVVVEGREEGETAGQLRNEQMNLSLQTTAAEALQRMGLQYSVSSAVSIPGT